MTPKDQPQVGRMAFWMPEKIIHICYTVMHLDWILTIHSSVLGYFLDFEPHPRSLWLALSWEAPFTKCRMEILKLFTRIPGTVALTETLLGVSLQTNFAKHLTTSGSSLKRVWVKRYPVWVNVLCRMVNGMQVTSNGFNFSVFKVSTSSPVTIGHSLDRANQIHQLKWQMGCLSIQLSSTSHKARRPAHPIDLVWPSPTSLGNVERWMLLSPH